jgi:glutamine synthetase
MTVQEGVLKKIGQERGKKTEEIKGSHSAQFASHVFDLHQMEMCLPKKTFEHIKAARDGKEKLDLAHAEILAEALKIWSLKKGATHFTHWFQPLTGAPAEKHDSFLSWTSLGEVVDKFKARDLLKAEPDASSFPSGGLRCTHQARGYTSWDIASPPFLFSANGTMTLCIPSLYFSWTGEPLDYKIPLLRSEEKLRGQVLRLLKMASLPAETVFSTVGIEQEYFLIDHNFYLLRSDLLLAGRTVLGAKPSKGQELEQHYFGPLNDRVIAYMSEFEEAAIQLGIPVKTRHNEVAPFQYEVAPLFERSSLAVDHNLLLMELMKKIALQHGLVALFHEKPFAKVNGSGKHNNWSLATDTGYNLLDPKEDSLVFLTLLTAVLRGVHDHAGLLRASIASAGNDHRLGGSEAPPTILSIYLGDALEKLVDQIIHDKKVDTKTIRNIDLGLSHILPFEADLSDRNRTSFFAFTGNKFEFRAVGASAHCASPLTVIHAIVADALSLILDEIGDVVKNRKLNPTQYLEVALPILRKHLKIAKPVLFSGNAYTAEWEKEAAQRGLPNITRSFHALAQFLDKKSIRAFEGILTEAELESRYEIWVEQYAKTMNIEANLLIELFRTQILPAAFQDLKNRAQSLQAMNDLGVPMDARGLESLKQISTLISSSTQAVDEVEKFQLQISDFGWEAKAQSFCDIVAPQMEKARLLIDRLETWMADDLWPLPKYRELLFIVD